MGRSAPLGINHEQTPTLRLGSRMVRTACQVNLYLLRIIPLIFGFSPSRGLTKRSIRSIKKVRLTQKGEKIGRNCHHHSCRREGDPDEVRSGKSPSPHPGTSDALLSHCPFLKRDPGRKDDRGGRLPGGPNQREVQEPSDSVRPPRGAVGHRSCRLANYSISKNVHRACSHPLRRCSVGENRHPSRLYGCFWGESFHPRCVNNRCGGSFWVWSDHPKSGGLAGKDCGGEGCF